MDNNRATPVTENNGRNISIFDRFNSEKYLSYFDSLYNQTKKYFVSISVDLYNAILEDCIDSDNISWFIETLSKDILKDNTSFIKIQNVIIPFDAIWSVDAKYKCTDMCKKYESIFSLLTLYSVLSITKASEPNSAEKRKIIHDVIVQYDSIIKIILDDIDDDDLNTLDDDVEKLNTERLVNRFFKALKKEDRDACLVILGMTDRLPIEFINHFKALLYFNEAEYEKAIFYAKKVANDKPYYNNAVAIILDSYASLGNFDGMLQSLNDAETLSISNSAIIYLMEKVNINFDCSVEYDITQRYMEILNICQSKDSNEGIAYDYYILKCIELFSESVKLVFKFCYDCCIYPIDYSLVSYITEKNKALQRLESIGNTIMLLNTLNDNRYGVFEETELINMLLDYPGVSPGVYISNGRSRRQRLKRKIRRNAIDVDCLDVLVLMNSDWSNYVLDKIKVCTFTMRYSIRLYLLETLYEFKTIDIFFKSIDFVLSDIISQGFEHEFIDERFSKLVLCAYIEGKARGWFDPNQKSDIEKFVEQRYNPNDYNDKIRIARLKKDLSISSQIAFDAAEEQYELSKTADWGWKDAGMISLAYYRIVELEINERLLIPIIKEDEKFRKDGKSLKIQELYKISKENLKDEKTDSGESIGKQYIECWSQNISKIIKQINPKETPKESEGKTEEPQEKTTEPEDAIVVHGLELGGLHFWFDALDKKDQFPEEKDELSKYLKDKIKEFLKEPQDLDKLIRHLNTTLLLDENREKYRNPPAHTTYLPYETACECREYVIENLTKFVSMLKDQNN